MRRCRFWKSHSKTLTGQRPTTIWLQRCCARAMRGERARSMMRVLKSLPSHPRGMRCVRCSNPGSSRCVRSAFGVYSAGVARRFFHATKTMAARPGSRKAKSWAGSGVVFCFAHRRFRACFLRSRFPTPVATCNRAPRGIDSRGLPRLSYSQRSPWSKSVPFGWAMVSVVLLRSAGLESDWLYVNSKSYQPEEVTVKRGFDWPSTVIATPAVEPLYASRKLCSAP